VQTTKRRERRNPTKTDSSAGGPLASTVWLDSMAEAAAMCEEEFCSPPLLEGIGAADEPPFAAVGESRAEVRGDTRSETGKVGR
jgi:hypothetical protein